MSASLPRILCVGAQKAGTSWLYENLRTNPAVWSPPFKEMHFFDYKFVADSRKWARWHVRSSIKKALQRPNLTESETRYLTDLGQDPVLNGNWYKRAYAPTPDGSIGIDATPEYCSVPDVGIQFIRKFLRDPFIIYLIRDPVTRALSQIRMNMERKKRSFDDRDAWMECARDPVVHARGDYRTYVPQWDNVFPNLLYLPFGAIAEDPLGVLRAAETYCGLPSFDYANSDRMVFPTVKAEAPSEVVSYLTRELAGQVDFLGERFGTDFMRRTV